MPRLVLALCAALLAGGCLKIYSPEVQQGNIVNQEMVDKLKPGMTRSQVRFVLGTPLLTDPFHTDRWDYVYFQKQSATAAPEQRRLTVIFEGDALTRMEGDVVTGTASTETQPRADAPPDPQQPPPAQQAL